MRLFWQALSFLKFLKRNSIFLRISLLKYISLLIFIVLVWSLFLPQYETITDGMLRDSLGFISQYPNPDEGGLFGGGYFTTFNGFGSLSAILNVICSFIIMIMLVLEELSLKIFKSLFILIIIFHLLSLLDIVIAPYILQDPSTLKNGFYILIIMEMALFYVAFVYVKQLPKTKNFSTDLIDNY